MTTPELSFATATELLAALPHLLGFVPADDLVALMLGPSQDALRIPAQAAIRCPLTITDEQAQRFRATCNLTAAQFPAAVLIAVCDADREDRAVAILNTVRIALHERGIAVLRMFTTHSLTEAGQWADPDTGASGNTVAFTDSPDTALGVLQGRLIAPSRADMQREFATIEAVPAYDAEAQDIGALIADTAYDLHWVITGFADSSPELAARAALVATAHGALRDGLLRLAQGHELSAGRLWTHIAAQHRGRARAELLTMAAIAYYAGEDTVRAGMALTHAAAAAREADTTLPRLAVMVQTALQSGLPPARIRGVIPSREKTPIPGTDL
jgi:hypothetical protein